MDEETKSDKGVIRVTVPDAKNDRLLEMIKSRIDEALQWSASFRLTKEGRAIEIDLVYPVEKCPHPDHVPQGPVEKAIFNVADAIAAEYHYWKDADGGVDTMMAMGACSNLLSVVYGLLEAKGGPDWRRLALELIDREERLYSYLGTSRRRYSSPTEIVAVFLSQIEALIDHFARVRPKAIPEALWEPLLAAAEIRRPRGVDWRPPSPAQATKEAEDGSEHQERPEAATGPIWALSGDILSGSGWEHPPGSPSIWKHPVFEGVELVRDVDGWRLSIGDVSVCRNASVLDLARLEALFERYFDQFPAEAVTAADSGIVEGLGSKLGGGARPVPIKPDPDDKKV